MPRPQGPTPDRSNEVGFQPNKQESVPSIPVASTRGAVSEILQREQQARTCLMQNGARALLAGGVVPEGTKPYQLLEVFAAGDDAVQQKLLAHALDEANAVPISFLLGMLQQCRELKTTETIARHILSTRPSGLTPGIIDQMISACPVGTTAHRLFCALRLECPETTPAMVAWIFEHYPADNRIFATVITYCRQRHYGPAEYDALARQLTNRSAMINARMFFYAEYAKADKAALIAEFEKRVRSGSMTPGRVHALLERLGARPDVTLTELAAVLSRYGRDIPQDYLQAAFSSPERQEQLQAYLDQHS